MALYDPDQMPAALQLQAHVAARTMLANPGNLAEAAGRLSVNPGDVTAYQVQNLLTLALYLLDLPEGYQEFNMAVFYEPGFYEDRLVEGIYCGTVACAVGHAPRALDLDPPEIVCSTQSLDGMSADEQWLQWSNENLGTLSTPVWQFCFGGFWTSCDNTPQGAAARIIYAVTCDHPRRLNPPQFMHSNSELCSLYQPLLEKAR